MALPGFRHFGLKVLSIVLAVLIWLAVSGEQIVERALRIPLEFTNLAPQLELVGDTPNVVDVRVRGSSGALESRRSRRARRGSRPAVGALGQALVSPDGQRRSRALRHRGCADFAVEHLGHPRDVGHEGRACCSGARWRSARRLRRGDGRRRSRQRWTSRVPRAQSTD